jgi:hypothetical protein
LESLEAGDYTLEIVIGTSRYGGIGLQHKNSFVLAFDSNGDQLWGFPQTGTIYSSITPADLDQDGSLELCFGIYDFKYDCLNSDGKPFRYQTQGFAPLTSWTSQHYDNQNTRYYDP